MVVLVLVFILVNVTMLLKPYQVYALSSLTLYMQSCLLSSSLFVDDFCKAVSP